MCVCVYLYIPKLPTEILSVNISETNLSNPNFC